ncbi:hypothetical protein [Streptomyces sp. BRA346]|uniref:hypothetical protein n=1 Tax=Streptomyces sp. BRA346 TaxID=2878199 RepID=UPI0040632F98
MTTSRGRSAADAPPPEVAYRAAPDLLREAADLLGIATDLAIAAESGLAADEEYHEERERLYRLRRAALADRMAIAHPEDEQHARDAVRLARELAEFDHAHRHLVEGPHGPDETEWDPSWRPYVRQEYDAWGW